MNLWKERIKPGLTKMWNSFCIYESPRYILVKDATLSIISKSIKLAVIVYVILYSIVLGHGYQRIETFTGIIYIVIILGKSTVKVKGSAKSASGRYFDAIDLVIPPIEHSGVFVTTNYAYTPHQIPCNTSGFDTKGSAPAEISEKCYDNKTMTCPSNKITANGISTGKCVLNNKGVAMCEISTWCPFEDDNTGRDNIIPKTANFTLFIRIDGRFPSYPYEPLSNVENKMVYNKNLFYLGDISAAGELTNNPLTPTTNEPSRLPLTYFNNTIEKGQIILIEYRFDCNLDYSLKKCKPEISFQRIDDSDFSSGFNYRYSNKYFKDGMESRDIWKIFGARIVIHVTGDGRKFDIIALLITVGSGIGLFGIADFICDNLLRFFVKEDRVYDIKYDDSSNSYYTPIPKKIFKRVERDIETLEMHIGREAESVE